MTRPSPLTGADQPDGVAKFVRAALRSGLIDPAQLQLAIADSAPEVRGDAVALAEHLIRKGKLSRYQSSKLLNGHWRGLFVGQGQPLGCAGCHGNRRF